MEAILSVHIVIDDCDGDDEGAKDGISLNAGLVLVVGVRDNGAVDGFTERRTLGVREDELFNDDGQCVGIRV